jgi:hypothetical protein
MKYISVEKNYETYKRQKFHKNSKNLTLVNKDWDSFIKHDFPDGEQSIVWLDYTDLAPSRLDEFMEVLRLVGSMSIVKITVRAEASTPNLREAKKLLSSDMLGVLRKAWIEDFQRQYDDFLSRQVSEKDLAPEAMPSLIQEMVAVAAQKVLPATTGISFQPLHSCCYADGVGMFSLTGAVCHSKDRQSVKRVFNDWSHSNLDWSSPYRIDLPNLSMKERLKLESRLPARSGTGKALQKTLGYRIDDGRRSSEEKLRQYQEYYPYYPQFAKVNV